MIYDIYISNYMNADGTAIVETEELLYSVPISNPDRALKDPVVKCEMGKTGAFEFSMMPTHPFYKRLLQMKTIMRVEYSGETIFRGRVLTIDDNPLNGTRKVHLEGDLAFLMDSYQEGVDDADRQEMTIYNYLTKVIQAHNDQMNVSGNQYKQFALGIVPGAANYENVTTPAQRITVGSSKFGSSSWKKTQDVLNELSKEYGGYFRTRYNSSTKVCYLDWLETYFIQTANTQPIKVTENMIDLSSASEVDNLFTVLIPIGSNNGGKGTNKIYVEGYCEEYHGSNRAITVPQAATYLRAMGRASEMEKGYHNPSDYDEAVNKYGVIYRTQEFGDADTQEKLWNTAINWIRDNYNGGITSFTATALDLHHLNPNSQMKFLVGQQVNIIYPDMSRHTSGSTPTITKMLTMISGQYNLHNPDKNTYTLGIPNSLLSKSYNRSKNKTQNDAEYKGGIRNLNQDFIELDKPLWDAADAYVISETFNNDLYKQLYDEDPQKAVAAAKGTTFIVNSVMTANEGTNVWLTNITHDKTEADTDSIYKDSNNSKWKLFTIYSTSIMLYPVDGATRIPASGSLTWVSGGVHHSTITYGEAEKRTDERVWISNVTHDKTQADKGSIYKASNNSQWELVSIYSFKLQLAPLNSSSKLPSSGTLTWVRGGTHHNSIVYGKTTSNAIKKTSRTISMVMDGINGKFVAGQPIKDDWLWSDDFTKNVNKFNQSVVIDAASGYMSFQDLLGNVSLEHEATKKNVLMKLGLEPKSNKKSGGVTLFGPDKVTDDNAKETTSLTGVNGAVNSMLGFFGKDGTGDQSTVDVSGLLSTFNMKDPDKAGSLDPEDVLLELTGGGGGGGGIGKKDDAEHPGEKKWQITLNKPIIYKDDKGVTHTVPSGTVGADDFYLDEIPSFKTNLAAINEAIIGVAHVGDLTAINAFIQNLQSDQADIDQISAKNIIGTAVTSSQFSGPLKGSKIEYSYYEQGAMHTTGMFYACTASESDGVITLTFKKSDGNDYTVNFNMADTQFYKDAVSAAKISGWSECFLSFSALGTTASKTLDYGESAVVNVTQKQANGNTVTRLERTYTAPSDRYSYGWSDCFASFSALGTTASKTLDYGESAVVNVTQKRADGSVVTRLERTYTAPSGGGSGTIDIQTRNQGGCGLYSTTLPVAYTYHELYTWVNSSTTPNPKTAKYVTFVVTCGNADKRYYCIDLSKFR